MIGFSVLLHVYFLLMKKTWFPVAADSDFSLHNLPYGIFSGLGRRKRVGVALGDHVIDMAALSKLGAWDGLGFRTSVFAKDVLNDFMALGLEVRVAVRTRLQDIFGAEDHPLAARRGEFLLPQSKLRLHLPIRIGDYTDFYSSEDHATNVGKMFRDPANALLPNWKHLPVGYHGRASSIFVSGTDFHRPKGQTRPDDAAPPVFGPTRLLDFELEMATVIAQPTRPGQSLSVAEAEDHVFGFLLFNDWSARDIQKWEYVPLGPFLAKNFFSSVSPWVVTLEALQPFRVEGPVQEPAVLPYLKSSGKKNFDVTLDVLISPKGASEARVCRSNFKHLYWNFAQQIAHHTVNGCNLNAGDLMASGTISGPTPDSFGSMLELSWQGKNPVPMSDGSERRFIQDGDTVIMRGYAEKDGIRVGFGELRNTVLPAI
jgi:fumarylacetoacetase